MFLLKLKQINKSNRKSTQTPHITGIMYSDYIHFTNHFKLNTVCIQSVVYSRGGGVYNSPQNKIVCT